MSTVVTPKRSKAPLILGILLVLILILAGGGWFALQYGGDFLAKQQLDAAIAKLPPETKASYKEVHSSLLDHKMSLVGFTMNVPGDEPATVSIDKLEVDNPAVNFDDTWAQIEAKTLKADKDTVIKMADLVSVDGLTVKAKDIEVSIGHYEIKNMRLHPAVLVQPSMPSFGDIDKLMKGLQAQAKVGEPDFDKLMPLLRYACAWLTAAEYDGGTLQNMTEKIHMPAAAGVPGGDVTATIEKETVDGLHKGVMGGVVVEKINEQVAGLASVEIEKVSMAPIDFHTAIEKIANGEAPSPDMLNGATWNGIKLEKLRVKSPMAGTVALDEFAIDKFGFKEGMLQQAEIEFKKLKLAKAQIPLAAEGFDALGLDSATISAELLVAYWPGVKTLHGQSMIDVAELGQLQDQIEIVSPDGIQGFATASTGQVPNLKFKHAKVHFVDRSLTGRLINAAAKEQGQAPAAFREQLIAMVRQQGQTLGNDPAIIAGINAVVDYIKDPKQFTVELAPPAAIGPEQADKLESMPPAKVIKVVGLKLTTNQEPEKKP